MAACRPATRVDKAEPHGLHSQATDIQFLVLVDGTRLRAKVWNVGSQTEPAG